MNEKTRSVQWIPLQPLREEGRQRKRSVCPKKAPTRRDWYRVSGDPTWGTACTVLGTTQMECSQRSVVCLTAHREAETLSRRRPLLTQSQREDWNQTSSPQPTGTQVAGLKPWKSLRRLWEQAEVVRSDT